MFIFRLWWTHHINRGFKEQTQALWSVVVWEAETSEPLSAATEGKLREAEEGIGPSWEASLYVNQMYCSPKAASQTQAHMQAASYGRHGLMGRISQEVPDRGDPLLENIMKPCKSCSCYCVAKQEFIYKHRYKRNMSTVLVREIRALFQKQCSWNVPPIL